MRYSIIIPLYNRPEEISELLGSLCAQDFLARGSNAGAVEVIIVEDGSTLSSRAIIEGFCPRLAIKYFEKENGGPALARNFGVERSGGEWLLFLDSDTVLPSGWLSAVDYGLSEGVIEGSSEGGGIDVFGGPDRASDDFTPVQKAINYSMTSFFTTGGIRGGKLSAEKFHPRSFNMGIRRECFERVGGFSAMRFGEDIDLSIRLIESGARCVLLSEAWVYHKRRVDFSKFFRQVRASGGARVVLSRKHSGSLKLVHLLPSAFVGFVGLSFIGSYFSQWALLPLGIWGALILVDATIKTRGIEIGVLSLWASFVQLMGYGIGFLGGLLGGGNGAAKNFYK